MSIPERTGIEHVNVRGKNMSDRKPLSFGGEPNTLIYSILGIGVVLRFAKLYYGIHVKPDAEAVRVKGPLVCVGNHPSYLDPFVMGAALKGRKVNFVAGAFLFRKRIVGPVFAAGGCIPKIQFRSDSRAVKAMLSTLKRGGTLGIFPEGTRFVDGTNITFDDALARMIKKTNSAVAFLKSHGAYSTWPRWSANSFRRGRIEGKIEKIYTVEEVEKMSVEELHAIMLEHLTYNEYDWLREHPVVFTSKAIASGAQNLAYVCPRCESESKIAAEGDILRCTVCGNRARMDRSGFFHPVGDDDVVYEDLHQWKAWERERIDRKILAGACVFEEKTRLMLPFGEYEYREVGSGVIRIDGHNVVYEGTQCEVEVGVPYSSKENKSASRRRKSLARREALKDGPEVKKVFPVSRVRGISVEYGKRFELIEGGGQVNRFVFENGQRTLELQLIIQALQEVDPYEKKGGGNP